MASAAGWNAGRLLFSAGKERGIGLGWSLPIDIDIFCGLNPCEPMR
mgnify:CR=1 FL=1